MKFLIIITLIASLHISVTAREPDELDRRIEASFGERAFDEDLAWMTEEIGPIVLERLLEKVQALRARSSEIRYEEQLLVRMGHLETIQRVVREMNQQGHPAP